jgi:hypothetical protein
MATKLRHPFFLYGEIEPDLVGPTPIEKGITGLIAGPTRWESGEDPNKWIMSGMVSHEAVDADGQEVDPAGIDWHTIFLTRGKITDGHPLTRENVIGEPLSVVPRMHKGRPGWYMRCRLYAYMERAKAVRRTHMDMIKSGASYAMGFSIEGDSIEEVGNRITKSIVHSVAVDIIPKHPYTYIEPMAASLGNFLAGGTMTKGLSGLGAEVRHRLEFARDVSDHELAAYRLLQQQPDMTFRDALRAVIRTK